MKVKQKNIRAFDFTVNDQQDEEEFITYLEQNMEILKSFLISITGEVSAKTKEFLEEKGLKTIFDSQSLQNRDAKAAVPAQSVKKNEKPDIEEESCEQNGLVNYDLPIRSGNIVECESDIIIFKRINSGAKVIAKKNAIIFGKVDGDVEANGDYLIIRDIGKGSVVFNGEEVQKDSIDGKLYRVVIKKGHLVYEELQ